MRGSIDADHRAIGAQQENRAGHAIQQPVDRCRIEPGSIVWSLGNVHAAGIRVLVLAPASIRRFILGARVAAVRECPPNMLVDDPYRRMLAQFTGMHARQTNSKVNDPRLSREHFRSIPHVEWATN
jgi:hypothetical protein